MTDVWACIRLGLTCVGLYALLIFAVLCLCRMAGEADKRAEQALRDSAGQRNPT